MVRGLLDGVNNLGLEPTTPGLKDVGYTCCSILLAMELEHIVRRLTPDLYLMCCPVLGAGAKFVNKSVNKSPRYSTGPETIEVVAASLIRSVNGP